MPKIAVYANGLRERQLFVDCIQKNALVNNAVCHTSIDTAKEFVSGLIECYMESHPHAYFICLESDGRYDFSWQDASSEYELIQLLQKHHPTIPTMMSLSDYMSVYGTFIQLDDASLSEFL